MELFRRHHEHPNLQPRPTRLPSIMPPELRFFAERTTMPRRGARVFNSSTTLADEWRNSGGKNACVCFEVQPELIFDGQGGGLFLARRTGKIRRDGAVDLTYHQFNIDRSTRPGSRSGKVTIYHILPQLNRKHGLGLVLRGAPSGGKSRRGAKQEANGAAAGESDADEGELMNPLLAALPPLQQWQWQPQPQQPQQPPQQPQAWQKKRSHDSSIATVDVSCWAAVGARGVRL
jgi:hypothetical protein